jgi:beta-1,4-mannosyltransferase
MPFTSHQNGREERRNLVIAAYPAFKNRHTNEFQFLLYSEMQTLGHSVREFDVQLRTPRRPDIIHLHWPEGLVLHASLLKTLIRITVFFLALMVYRFYGSKVVWTIHNLRSHETYHPRVERWFWNRLYRFLDGWVALSRSTLAEADRNLILRRLPREVIPHGLYPVDPNLSGPRRALSHHFGLPEEMRTFLVFGRIRVYKQIPALMDLWRGSRPDGAVLVIAGDGDPAEVEKIRRLTGESGGAIVFINSTLSARERDDLFHMSTGVIIPYGEILNTGVAFLALAHGRPCLAPRIGALEELAAELPDSQLHFFRPPLAGGDLERFLGACSQGNSPVLSDRFSWRNAAERHEDFFSTLLGLTQYGRPARDPSPRG